MSDMPKNTTANTILNTRATSKFWGFITMIETAIDGNPKFNLSSIIDEYWETTFPDKDSEDFTTYENIMMLQYQLLFIGFASYDIKMKKKFLNNYKHFIFGMYDLPDETEIYYQAWDKKTLRLIKK